MSDVTLLVIAKEPLAGQAKTRLSPPFSLEQAAELAGAALRDTLAVVAATPARRRVLVFAGDPIGWAPAEFSVVPQRGAGLAERLACAFDGVDGPALLVGMDTPQLTTELLREAAAMLSTGKADAVLGPAPDGGYWAVGLKDPSHSAAVFHGVPMSEPDTMHRQSERLQELGLSFRLLSPLQDVDTAADALLVAQQAPGTRFAALVCDLASAARSEPAPVAA